MWPHHPVLVKAVPSQQSEFAQANSMLAKTAPRASTGRKWHLSGQMRCLRRMAQAWICCSKSVACKDYAAYKLRLL